MSSWELTDTRALITGASSGIGREAARLFVNAGAKVLATGRNEESLLKLEVDLEHAPGTIHILAGDLTDEAFRNQLIEAAIEALGGLDTIVNAAGIIASADWNSTTLEDWDHMMDINLRSLFALTKMAIPSLIESGGAVVNVSSVTGLRAFPGVLAYCVSKAGVDQLTRCLALELAEKGVRVNAVNPGVVRTNLHRAGGMEEERYAAFLEHSRGTHPLGRVGEPEEVAELIAFLASDSSGWITGETVSIDGGRHQTCAR